jgi:hypothetical protein
MSDHKRPARSPSSGRKGPSLTPRACRSSRIPSTSTPAESDLFTSLAHFTLAIRASANNQPVYVFGSWLLASSHTLPPALFAAFGHQFVHESALRRDLSKARLQALRATS